MNNNDLHISGSCELCSLNTPASPGESGVICSEHAATQGALAKKKTHTATQHHNYNVYTPKFTEVQGTEGFHQDEEQAEDENQGLGST